MLKVSEKVTFMPIYTHHIVKLSISKKLHIGNISIAFHGNAVSTSGQYSYHVGRDGIPVTRPDSQLREPGFKSHCGRFEPLASLITPRCYSSLSCINEYLANTDSGGNVNK